MEENILKPYIVQESYKANDEVELILHKSKRSWTSAHSERSTTVTDGDVEVQECNSTDDITKTEPFKKRTATVSPSPVET